MLEYILFMLLGAILVSIGYYVGSHSKEFKAYEDMKGFANAYSELAIGMFNSKNNEVVPFMDHGNSPEIVAEEEQDPQYDLLGGVS